jgi:hypothetical protein
MVKKRVQHVSETVTEETEYSLIDYLDEIIGKLDRIIQKLGA